MLFDHNQHNPVSIGDFRTVGVLGEGGMGVVYKARHKETNELVALKTVRALDENQLVSIRREIYALSLLKHPGIVQVVAHGTTHSLPWYAMELLEGETLGGYFHRLWRADSDAATPDEATVRAKNLPNEPVEEAAPKAQGAELQGKRPAAAGQLPQLLTLIRKVCEALAFLHGEGIIHRDLKPSNIFLTQNNRPVLVDFGLARRTLSASGREVLDISKGLEGTPRYMSPEQIRGEPVDTRADIYALGCVLYEVIAGRPPFQGYSHQQVLRQHLHNKPTPPTWFVSGLPSAVEEVVLSMMEKNPRERAGHARDIALALAPFCDAEESAPARSKAFVYRPSLIGREAQLRELNGLVRGLMQGAGGFAWISGQSGIGKTSLVGEVARRAGAEVQVLTGACAARDGAPLRALSSVFSWLSDRCWAQGKEETAKLLGTRAKALCVFEPSLANVPGAQEYPAPPELDGPAARAFLVGCVRETLEALCAERPVLLLLDDLQWADELTLHLLKSFPSDWFLKNRLVLLATSRSNEESEALRAVKARPYIRVLSLERLSQSAVRSVVGDMLALESPPSALVEFLYKRSQGNPFFVAEYLRAAVDGGLIERVSRKRLRVGDKTDGLEDASLFEALPLPLTQRELLGRRFKGLSANARRFAEAASVLGKEFEEATLWAISGGADTEAMEGLTELLHRQVLEQAERGFLRFAHDKLCEAIYEELSAERRRALHQSAAAFLEERAQKNPAGWAALAQHWIEAKNLPKALDALELAGEHALRTASYGEATAAFSRAVEISTRDPKTNPQGARRLARWEHGIGRAKIGLGDLDAFEEHARLALLRLGRPMPQSALGWGLRLAKEALHQARTRLGFAPKKMTTQSQREDLGEAAIAANLMSFRYYFVERALEMITSALASVNLAESAGVAERVSRSYATLGLISGLVGLESLAASYFTEAHRGAEHSRDPSLISYALMVEGVYHAGYGRFLRAEEAIQKSAYTLAGVEDPVNQGLLSALLGHMEYYTGRIKEALARYTHAREAALLHNNPQHATWGLFAMARSLVQLGRFSEALPLLQEAQATLQKKPELQSEVICFGLLAQTQLRLGDKQAALATAQEALAKILKSQPTGFPAVDGYTATAETLLELQESADSKPLAQQREKLLRAFKTFARVFPMARASLALHNGHSLRLKEKFKPARSLYEKSLAEARRCGMPRDEALALLALASVANTQAEQEAFASEATAIFTRLGCSFYLSLCRALPQA